MIDQTRKPVVFLAFANSSANPLPHLAEEYHRLETILKQAQDKGHCELVVAPYATVDDILGTFQDEGYRGRIAFFHYAGHADSYRLLLQGANGQPAVAHAGGLAAFLGHQSGLQLVFLNACSTQAQAQALLDAGVAVVIATAQAIDDQVATDFASRFYQFLADGDSIGVAFDKAQAAVQFERGGDLRHLYVPVARETALANRWPWDCYVRPGSEVTLRWNLPDAADDPLFGLPPIPEKYYTRLPEGPFRGLTWFATEHAALFFGRGYQIRELYGHITAPPTPPLILFYGQSGVGKSSLLAAGLTPRLENSHTICYRRRDQYQGLLSTLQAALLPGVASGETSEVSKTSEVLDLAQSWLALEAELGKPLLVILDQAEEVFTRPNPDQPHELADFLAALQSLSADPERSPQGKLILGFRKEWLAEVKRQVEAHKLPHTEIFLRRLDRRGVMEAIQGPTQLPELQAKYGLTVADELPGLIADDLLADRGSAVAPMLQILLTKLWREAKHKSYDRPTFDQELYAELRRQGLGLGDILDQQMVELSRGQPEAVVTSGLALDLLAFHTTPLGTAEEHTREELRQTYAHRQEVLEPLIQDCESLYLLVDPARNEPAKPPSSRLAHDTLAPLVRRRFDESDAPGQRARRILENRAVEWEADQEGATLDEQDLALVEAGAAGMRAWTGDEERLVAASRAERARHKRNWRILWGAGIVAVVLIVAAAIVAVQLSIVAEQRQLEAEKAQADAEKQANLALSRLLVIQSDNQLNANNNQLALLLAVEAGNTTDTPEAVDALYAVLPRIRYDLVSIPGAVVKAGWNADGTRLIIIGEYGAVSVWDWSKAETYHLNLSGHSGPITQVAWNPDGTHILTASMDGTVRVWQIEPSPAEQGSDADNGSLILSHPGPVMGATWSADSTRILATSCLAWSYPDICLQAFAQVWDAQTGAKLSSFIHPGRSPLAPSPLGPVGWLATWNAKATRILTTGCVGDLIPPDRCDAVAVQVWDAETEERLAPLFGHSSWVNQAVWNEDGSLILTASDDGTARVWDVETGKELLPSLNHEFKVEQAAWNADETRILTSTRGGTAHLWDAKTGFEIQRFAQDAQAGWNSRGNLILTTGQDDSLRVLDVETGAELITLLGHKGRVARAAWNAKGTRLVTLGRDGTVRLWDAEITSELPTLYGHTDWVEQAVWNADGTRILTASRDDTARIWDADRGITLVSFSGHSDVVNRAVWNPRETRILTASRDGTARIWDAETGDNLITLSGHTDSVEQAVWNTDGTLILTASRDGTARIWEAETGDELTSLDHPEPVQEAAWNANETRILTLSLDNTARVWGAEAENEMRVLVELSGVRQALWRPDGARILTLSSEDDQFAQVHDAETGVELVTLAGHSDRVNQALWNEQGTHILTASEDGAAKVWDAQTGDEILNLNHVGGIDQAGWNADETLIFTRDFSKVRIWDAQTGTNLVTRSEHARITHVMWNGDGSRLLVTNLSGSVRQYFAPRTEVLVKHACQLVSRNLNLDEWRTFMDDEPYRATCPNLPTEDVE